MVISYLRKGKFANKLVFIGDNEFNRNFNSLSQAKAVKNVMEVLSIAFDTLLPFLNIGIDVSSYRTLGRDSFQHKLTFRLLNFKDIDDYLYLRGSNTTNHVFIPLYSPYYYVTEFNLSEFCRIISIVEDKDMLCDELVKGKVADRIRDLCIILSEQMNWRSTELHNYMLDTCDHNAINGFTKYQFRTALAERLTLENYVHMLNFFRAGKTSIRNYCYTWAERQASIFSTIIYPKVDYLFKKLSPTNELMP